MTMMQTFRDGPRTRPGAVKSILWNIWDLLLSILGVAMMVMAIVSYAHGDFQRATFQAVIVLWLILPTKYGNREILK